MKSISHWGFIYVEDSYSWAAWASWDISPGEFGL